MAMTKQALMQWIEHQIKRVSVNLQVERPCIEGLHEALKCLTEDTAAKTTGEAVLTEDVKSACDDLQYHLDTAMHGDKDKQAMRTVINYIRTSPLMPENPSDEIVSKLYGGGHDDGSGRPHVVNIGRRRYNALHTALMTPPKPKMKTVWYSAARGKKDKQAYVWEHSTQDEADRNRKCAIACNSDYDSVSPVWSQEVPA
jgi:hypothetical protein